MVHTQVVSNQQSQLLNESADVLEQARLAGIHIALFGPACTQPVTFIPAEHGSSRVCWGISSIACSEQTVSSMTTRQPVACSTLEV